MVSGEQLELGLLNQQPIQGEACVTIRVIQNAYLLDIAPALPGLSTGYSQQIRSFKTLDDVLFFLQNNLPKPRE